MTTKGRLRIGEDKGGGPGGEAPLWRSGCWAPGRPAEKSLRKVGGPGGLRWEPLDACTDEHLYGEAFPPPALPLYLCSPLHHRNPEQRGRGHSNFLLDFYTDFQLDLTKVTLTLRPGLVSSCRGLGFSSSSQKRVLGSERGPEGRWRGDCPVFPSPTNPITSRAPAGAAAHPLLGAFTEGKLNSRKRHFH